MLSPSFSRITKRIRSSITELLPLHGLYPPFGGQSVTHVSGTFCYLCLGTVRTAPVLPPQPFPARQLEAFRTGWQFGQLACVQGTTEEACQWFHQEHQVRRPEV